MRSGLQLSMIPEFRQILSEKQVCTLSRCRAYIYIFKFYVYMQPFGLWQTLPSLLYRRLLKIFWRSLLTGLNVISKMETYGRPYFWNHLKRTKPVASRDWIMARWKFFSPENQISHWQKLRQDMQTLISSKIRSVSGTINSWACSYGMTIPHRPMKRCGWENQPFRRLARSLHSLVRREYDDETDENFMDVLRTVASLKTWIILHYDIGETSRLRKASPKKWPRHGRSHWITFRTWPHELVDAAVTGGALWNFSTCGSRFSKNARKVSSGAKFRVEI